MSSLTKNQMLLLMQLADGELEGTERAEAERLVAEDEEAATFVSEMLGLGEQVTSVAVTRAASVDLDGVADSIMAGIEKQKAQDLPAKVRSLGEARAERNAKQAKKTNWTAPVVGILALAASVAFVVRMSPSKDDGASAQNTAKPAQTAAQTAVQVAAASTPSVDIAAPKGEVNGVDVNVVESPAHAVSVFVLPASTAAASSVVVWIDDSAGEK